MVRLLLASVEDDAVSSAAIVSKNISVNKFRYFGASHRYLGTRCVPAPPDPSVILVRERGTSVSTRGWCPLLFLQLLDGFIFVAL